MTLLQIIESLKEYIGIAFFTLLLLLILYFIFYELIYKKVMHGKKQIKLNKLIIIFLFIGYIIIIIGATFLHRGASYNNEISLILFSSYKEAYISGELSNWQNIILNILLFIPMGFLLPLLTKKCRKLHITVAIGLLTTVIIECLQFVLNYGIFEIDDIFNNTLGTLIGYCAINILLVAVNRYETRKISKILVNCLPLILTVVTFVGIFAKYNLQEFGNLPLYSVSKFNLKNIQIENNIQNEKKYIGQTNIYKTEKLSVDDVKNLAKNILRKTGSEINPKYIISFDNFATTFHSTNNQLLNIDYIGGTYTLTYDNPDTYKNSDNFSQNTTITSTAQNTEITSSTQINRIEITDKETIIEKLIELGIEINYDYTYYLDEKNNHIFDVNMYNDNGKIIDGVLSCYLCSDGSYRIQNNLIKYIQVKECKIISEKEAYNKLVNGKFKIDSKNKNIGKIQKLEIVDVEVDYMLDSKLYYQPVYKYGTYINNENSKKYVYIPAL